MFAVCVTFKIHPESLPAFLPLMRAQAENSLDLEPDCLRFDIWSDDADPEAVYLYEIYRDAAAFQVHLESDHFKSFNDATLAMVAEKSVKTWNNPIQVDAA